MPAVSIKRKRLSVALDDFVDRIARGARDGRDDRAIRAGEKVQQSGFAHVGMSDDGDLGFVGLRLFYFFFAVFLRRPLRVLGR